MNWSQISDQARALDIDRLGRTTRRALRDKKTRDALAKTVTQSRATYARFAGDDAKTGLAKLAKDAKTQQDVGALVRSVADAIDTGLTRRPRRSRWRRLGMLSAIGVAIAAVVAKRRRSQTPPAVHETTTDVVEPLNGAVAEAERSLRI